MALIFTTLGEIEESLLEKRTGVDENDHERSQWEEYWKDGVCVKRSVDLYLKTGLFGGSTAAGF